MNSKLDTESPTLDPEINYKKFCEIFFYFDCMLRTTTVNEDEFIIDNEEYNDLNNLVRYKLENN